MSVLETHQHWLADLLAGATRTAWLVYTDWLQEHVGEDVAQLVRKRLAMVRGAGSECQWRSLHEMARAAFLVHQSGTTESERAALGPPVGTAEAARILGCTPSAVQTFIRKGLLPAALIGPAWLIDRTALARFKAPRNGKGPERV